MFSETSKGFLKFINGLCRLRGGVVIQVELVDGAKETLPSIRAAYYRIEPVVDGLIMVGNSLSRDIASANHFGITSVFFDRESLAL